MDSESFSEDEEESFCFCQYLQNCLLPGSPGTCFFCSPCCMGESDYTEKDQKFPRIQYRPVIDSNILTGNTLLQSTQGTFYFPQTSQTLWPEHGSHHVPATVSPVISEQPFGSEKVRRSTRILAALKGRRRSTATSAKRKQQKFVFDSTSTASCLSQSSSIEDPNQPTLTFAIIHDIQASTLTVFLKFASNLDQLFENPQKQNVHFFVTLHILPSKNEILQTSAKPSTEATSNPVFDDEFVFDGVPIGEVAEQTLVFRVFHGRALIGILKIPLSSIDLLGFTISKPICKRTDSPDFEVIYNTSL